MNFEINNTNIISNNFEHSKLVNLNLVSRYETFKYILSNYIYANVLYNGAMEEDTMTTGINSGDFVEHEKEWFVILNPFIDTDPNNSIDIFKNIFAKSVKTGMTKRLDYEKITNIVSSIEVFTNMNHLHDALKALVKMNEDHNAAVETVIGRPLNWSDSYLDKARTAIIYTDAMYDKNKHK